MPVSILANHCVLWLNDTSYSKSVWRSETEVPYQNTTVQLSTPTLTLSTTDRQDRQTTVSCQYLILLHAVVQSAKNSVYKILETDSFCKMIQAGKEWHYEAWSGPQGRTTRNWPREGIHRLDILPSSLVCYVLLSLLFACFRCCRHGEMKFILNNIKSIKEMMKW